MHKTLAFVLVALAVCTPEFAPATEDPAITHEEIMGIFARLPPERCLYTGKHCEPAHFERGPDAQRIAAAISTAADGRLTGTRAGDAALMAVFSSYESDNNANAIGDGGKAIGAFQIHYFGDSVLDPTRAALVWRSIAQESIKVCSKNQEDERLASVAGGCSIGAAKRKVRQRVAAAHVALEAPVYE